MKAILSVIVILYFVKGTFSAMISAPENVIDIPGSKLILNCKSSATVSNADISWFYSQFSTNYTATVVSGCTPADSNSFSVISDTVGECNLVIDNLDGRYAGLYTCQNGAEPPVSANVGVIVSGPFCWVYPNSSLIEGQAVNISCAAAYTGSFGINIKKTFYGVGGAKPESLTAPEPSNLADDSDWTASPNISFQSTSTILAKIPTLQQIGYSINFSSAIPNPPMGNATNQPTYQFEWISPSLPVMYPPATSRMVIDGCITPLPLGAELTCSAQADPVANYTWLHPNSTVSEGTKVKLNYLGSQLNYTCVATNSVGSAGKSCIVSVLEYVNSAPDSITVQSFSFRALLLLGVVIGYVKKTAVL